MQNFGLGRAYFFLDFENPYLFPPPRGGGLPARIFTVAFRVSRLCVGSVVDYVVFTEVESHIEEVHQVTELYFT